MYQKSSSKVYLLLGFGKIINSSDKTSIFLTYFLSNFKSQSNSRNIFELYHVSGTMLFCEMPSIPMRLSDSRLNILVVVLEESAESLRERTSRNRYEGCDF